jgi:L-fuconolactonase
VTFTDAHMHFWDRDAVGGYTWLHEVPTISHRHTTENLRAEAPAHLPEKIVFVEAGAAPLREVQWVSDLAVTEPRIRGIVAKILINADAQTTADLAALRRYPLVKGVRHHFEHDPIDYCAQPEFIRGVQEAADLGYSFDICCKHPQLPAVIELVRQCPQATFILDHGGKPGIRTGLLDPWRAHIRTLAEFPNIVGKLSGLATEADHANWAEVQFQPYAAHLLDCFGPSRLLFGGDWPVAKLAIGYTRWLEIAQRFLAQLSETEQAAVFRDNADRVYRL